MSHYYNKDFILSLAISVGRNADKHLDVVLPYESAQIRFLGYEAANDLDAEVERPLSHLITNMCKPHVDNTVMENIELNMFDYIAEARDSILKNYYEACNMIRVEFQECGDIYIAYPDGTAVDVPYDQINVGGNNHD